MNIISLWNILQMNKDMISMNFVLYRSKDWRTMCFAMETH